MLSEKMVMDNRSSQPLYLRIKDALKQRILDGDYTAHERLPSESELMKMFGVSRITVRQSLRDLHSDGLVFSVQGKGTFVSKPKAVQDVQRLQGFGEAMTPKGYETSTRVLFQDYSRPSQEVADAFSISRAHRVYEVKRIRYLNREPISFDHSFFPAEIGAKLEHHDLAQDIFPMLENQFGESLGYADLKIGVTAADEQQARALNVEVNSPCLRINRAVFSRRGKPIDYEFLTYRGDAFQYQLKVDRY
ncbi:MAG TPA: GntR family transcriptional regulator [Gammaproteobacteria bacterium]